MPQDTSSKHAESEPSSSFPISSPSFWAEAVTLANPDGQPEHGPVKRPRSPNDCPRNTSPTPKRSRHSSSSPPSEHHHGLTFLPNPTDILAPDDPHSYLANPEYAPNRFGDIGDYMRKKEIKVQAQNANIAAALRGGKELPQIFETLSFYINGNTHPPMEQLRKLILQRGGTVYPVLRNKTMVDYIIAPVLTVKKHEEFKKYKVVKEGWIVDSVQQEKLLDWRKWRLVPQGGWLESSRKGLEGFFAGKGKGTEEEHDSGASDQDVEVVEQSAPADVTSNVTPQKPAAGPIQRILTPQRPRHLIIPISPGQIASDSSPIPTPRKLQAPEGAWEHYYTKDSNENAAKAMQSTSWRAQNTAEQGNAGGFIDGYYQNSRLHHLSMWKAELKVLVRDAQKRSEEALAKASQEETAGEAHSLAKSALPSLPLPTGPSTANRASPKVIFHVDFDAFFVSCGLSSRPHLKGKPTVVCHSSGKGGGVGSTSEIASCSYEARAKGVKNGMSLGRARELVGAEIQTMPYEFETYKKFSLSFYTILMGYADELQAVSVDEALIDVTSQVAARAALPPEVGIAAEGKERDPAVELAEKIRADVRQITDGCEVSIGIAHNILLARLATRHAKPAGVHHLQPTQVSAFIETLPIDDFPSIGHSTKSKIEAAFGTTIAGELMGITKSRWRGVLGEKTGEMVHGFLRGVDGRKLEADKVRKSVSAEMNYGIRFQTQEQAEKYVGDLAAEVSKRMRNVGVKGRQVTLKLMQRHPDAPIEPPKFMGHGWCETHNRSSPLPGGPIDSCAIIAQESIKLLRTMRLDPKELRGVGIQVTKLDSEQPSGGAKEAGQAVLSFTRADKGNGAENAKAGPSRVPVSSSKERLDGIDPDFLAALPASLAEEVKRDHALAKRNPSKSPASPTPAAKDPARLLADKVPAQEVISIQSSSPIEVVSEVLPKAKRTTSPSKLPTKDGKNAAAHIVKQLRPKGKVQMKAGQVAEGPLFGAWNRVEARAMSESENIDELRNSRAGSIVVDLTVSPPLATERDITTVHENDEDSTEVIPGYTTSYLRSLSIDPEFLLALPSKMQQEAIQEQVEKERRRKALWHPGGGARGISKSVSVSPVKGGAKGRDGPKSLQPAQAQGLKIIIPPKPSLMNATTLPDILDTVEKWIDSRKNNPPAERDAGKVLGYLRNSMNESMKGGKVGDGADRCVEVLRWMRILLREKWWDKEEGGTGLANEAGEEWWRVWRAMRDEVNSLSVQKFGATLVI
ncbi:hypothetical protein I350_03659 [Cryptococcus amylolentus CBS 6273]|uniref:DNA repair protein REV1 n=1 Tax=Cryptococcus amylolentus CBS 6273 TaxID=1296118 RepID=A0A1E3K585_9TREE|nr:hypothetical protein I350_03659 [Cryptococcus amylolentus CBS 6273]